MDYKDVFERMIIYVIAILCTVSIMHKQILNSDAIGKIRKNHFNRNRSYYKPTTDV